MSLALVALTACGGASATAPEVEAPHPEESMSEPEGAMAPTPYTSAQIAAACAPGRFSLFEDTDADGAVTYSRTTFVEGAEGLATFEMTAADADGAPLGEARTVSVPWDALRDHASYPASQTTITDATIETPAGRFETRHYEVAGEDGTTTHAWFARSLPGPPVRHEVRGPDGALVSSMVLRAFHDPR